MKFLTPSLTAIRSFVYPGAALLWVFVLALAGVGTAQAYQVTDDRGVVISFDKPPLRLVSLMPSLTETVCALGQCDRLMGVDRHSNHPDRVKRLPQVGSGMNPDLDAIVALKPDLVLMASAAQVAARLQALGLKVMVLEPKTHADVRQVIDKLGQVLGVTDAWRVWQGIEAAMQAAAQSLPAQVKTKRVYFEVNRAPYAAGEASFIGETLTWLGVKNIVPASMGAFPLINPEFVVRADPDVIMVGDVNFSGMSGRPGWADLRAITTHQVCVFTPAQSDMLVRPGPRMADAARLMAQCLLKVLP